MLPIHASLPTKVVSSLGFFQRMGLTSNILHPTPTNLSNFDFLCRILLLSLELRYFDDTSTLNYLFISPFFFFLEKIAVFSSKSAAI